MGGEYTPAQKQASKKYMVKKKEIHIVVEPEDKETIKQRAKSIGLSVNRYILALIACELRAQGYKNISVNEEDIEKLKAEKGCNYV